jgi:deoxyribodipyrimidine photo-lyase
MQKVAFFWFRRDLRLEDNAGLYHALKSGKKVICIFIFDTCILEHLPKDDARVNFLHEAIVQLDQSLQSHGSKLMVRIGKPAEVWADVVKEYDIANVYINKDFEPYANERDGHLHTFFSSKGIGFHTYKDHVIFEAGEVLKDDGKPYTVFTPYKRKWLAKIESRIEKGLSFYYKAYPTHKYFKHFLPSPKVSALPTLEGLGFSPSSIKVPPKEVRQGIIKDYDKDRDFPAIDGTSRLGIHFRFGTISIRDKAMKAAHLNATYLSELVWRDFYAQILTHFPHVAERSFRPEYDKIEWRYDETEFDKWKNGMTGYPIVDAGMRELNTTGHMHNRVRMITASFLTKHLLMDWRLGEAYFAERLLDFDLASNNGGWQWAAGCGTDAAPYFRIFSPAAQEKKFDKDRVYIKKWVPEIGTQSYPNPVVDHAYARERCLLAYKTALK